MFCQFFVNIIALGAIITIRQQVHLTLFCPLNQLIGVFWLFNYFSSISRSLSEFGIVCKFWNFVYNVRIYISFNCIRNTRLFTNKYAISLCLTNLSMVLHTIEVSLIGLKFACSCLVHVWCIAVQWLLSCLQE